MKKFMVFGMIIALSFAGAHNSYAQGWQVKGETWQYEKADSTIAMQEWVLDNGLWYYLDENGNMVTGWYLDTDQNWYYLKEDGSMAVQEWITEDGQSYYLGVSGAWELDNKVERMETAPICDPDPFYP